MKRYRWLILAIFLAALFRFWNLDGFPPGLYHDEAYNGLDALALLQGESFPQFYEGWELYAAEAHADQPPQPRRFPLFFEGNYGREPLHIYLMALSIRWFDNTAFAIRAVPAAGGVLAVLTTYLAATALMADRQEERDKRFVPLFAAIILAVLFPAVHFSRFGLRAMLFVPVETLAVACFWQGIKVREQFLGSKEGKPRRSTAVIWFLATGLLLGLGIYIYAAARLFPFLFLLFVLIWFWRARAAMANFWWLIVIMALVSLLSAAPLLVFFSQYPYFFIFRISYVANRGQGVVVGKPWLTWLLNTGRVFRGLFWQGETHLRHNLPGRPYLDLLQAGLLLIGLGRLGKGWQRRTHMFLLLWLAVMLLPTILSGDAPHFGRMTGAAPVIAIIAAQGLSWLRGRVTGRRMKAYLPAALLTASVLWTGFDYFYRYAAEPQLAADFYLLEWELGQFAAAQTQETLIYLTPTQEEMATFYYALGDPTGLASFSPGTALPLGRPRDSILYLIRPSEMDTLQRLQLQFPNGAILPSVGNAIPFRVPAARVETPYYRPQRHEFGANIQLIGWDWSIAGDDLVVTLMWESLAKTANNYTAYLHLVDGSGNLISQVDRPPDGYPTADWRPGERIMDIFELPLTPDLRGTFTLSSGFYLYPSLQPLGGPVTLMEWNVDNE